MHHSLRLYGKYQHQMLRLYLLLAKLTRVPLMGRWVRNTANSYGRRGHNGYLLTLAEAEQIVDASREVALGPCSCRQITRRCDGPVMAEILLGSGVEVFKGKAKGSNNISREEAKAVLRQCHEKRMTHSIMRCGEHFYAICNCCSCCCIPTRLKKEYGIEYALVRSKTVVEDYRRHQM